MLRIRHGLIIVAVVAAYLVYRKVKGAFDTDGIIDDAYDDRFDF